MNKNVKYASKSYQQNVFSCGRRVVKVGLTPKQAIEMSDLELKKILNYNPNNKEASFRSFRNKLEILQMWLELDEKRHNVKEVSKNG